MSEDSKHTKHYSHVSSVLQACEEYDDALSSGQQAFLLEESDQSPDIFSLSVGSLPPGESASIRLEYVTELAVQADDGLRFCLPAVLNPRYQPQGRKTSQHFLIIHTIPVHTEGFIVTVMHLMPSISTCNRGSQKPLW